MEKSLSQKQADWFQRYQIARAIAAAKAGR
jgi:hypothetical protein